MAEHRRGELRPVSLELVSGAQLLRRDAADRVTVAVIGAEPGVYAGALGVPQFLPSSYRRYAVDFNHDGRRDLWNNEDAIGSIANYYKSHGWQTGEPVFVAVEQQASGPSDEFMQLLERGIKPHTTVDAIRRAGASPAQVVADAMPAAVFNAETEAGMRYWIGFNNFYVITRYNRSVNYALAVHELAHELRRLRTAGGVE